MPTLTELLASGKYSKRAAQKTIVKARAEVSPEQRKALSLKGIRLIIDGVEYQSLTEASRTIGVGWTRLKNVLTKKNWQPLAMEDLFPSKEAKPEAKPEAKDHLGNAFKTRKDMVLFYAWFYKTSEQHIYYRLRTMPLKEALDWPGRPWRQDYVPTNSQRA